jgi:hypothetical protein
VRETRHYTPGAYIPFFSDRKSSLPNLPQRRTLSQVDDTRSNYRQRFKVLGGMYGNVPRSTAAESIYDNQSEIRGASAEVGGRATGVANDNINIVNQS